KDIVKVSLLGMRSRYTLPMNAPLYQEVLLPPRLARFLDRLWMLSQPPGVGRTGRLIVPDGLADLIFRIAPGPDGAARCLLQAFGTPTRPLASPQSDAPLTVAARFLPGGAYPFFGPMRDLTDQTAPLSELWGDEGERLLDALAVAPSREAQA